MLQTTNQQQKFGLDKFRVPGSCGFTALQSMVFLWGPILW